jgi:hypothetical protein
MQRVINQIDLISAKEMYEEGVEAMQTKTTKGIRR